MLNLSALDSKFEIMSAPEIVLISIVITQMSTALLRERDRTMILHYGCVTRAVLDLVVTADTEATIAGLDSLKLM